MTDLISYSVNVQVVSRALALLHAPAVSPDDKCFTLFLKNYEKQNKSVTLKQDELSCSKKEKIKIRQLDKMAKEGGVANVACGRDYVIGGVDSVRCGLGAERRQRGGKHQHLSLHEGKIGQTCDYFSRLLAQILVFLRLPVKNRRKMLITPSSRYFYPVLVWRSTKILGVKSLNHTLNTGNSTSGLPGLWPLTWWRCWSSPWWTSGERRRRPPACRSCQGPAWLSSARTVQGPRLKWRQRKVRFTLRDLCFSPQQQATNPLNLI